MAGTENNIPRMVGCRENIQDLFQGNSVSLLTREEVQRIFEDIESCLEDNEDNVKRVTKKIEVESIKEDTVTSKTEYLSRRSVKSTNKSKSFVTKLRKGLFRILQKLINRKKTNYYRRMASIKSQWVILETYQIELLQSQARI